MCWLLAYDRADWRRVKVRVRAGFKYKQDKDRIRVDSKDWFYSVRARAKFVWGDPPRGP